MAYDFKVIKFCFYFASLLLLGGLIAVGPTEFAFNLGISKNSISIFLTTKVLVFYVLAYIQRDRLAPTPSLDSSIRMHSNCQPWWDVVCNFSAPRIIIFGRSQRST